MPPYVPLHMRSVYSLERGTASVDALAAQAARYGHHALALADRNGLYGAVPFTLACRRQGVRPILGAEVDGPEGRVVLLVRDAAGYANLCRILTRRRLDPAFRLLPAVFDWRHGLHVLTADPSLLGRLGRGVARDALWAELPASRPGRFSGIAEAASALGVRTVAGGAVNGVGREEHRLHATLTAIRRNTLVGRLAPDDLAPREAYFKAPAAVASLFRRHRDALAATRELAASCGFELRRERWIFPDPPLPPGESAASHLRALCEAGLVRRYGRATAEARRRLERELEVIERLGFSPYFVVVGEILRFARERGIPSVGRGSGAGALTAYLLGITNVDPLRYRLYFERFLHEKRPDHPDLDIDLCWVRRDEVIDHVYAAYGRDRVAMISTHNTFQPRSAFREVAKAHGVAHATVNRLAHRVPHSLEGSLREALAAPARGSAVPVDEPPWPRILDDAQAMIGMPRHLGLHPGGIVLSDEPLDTVVPLERAAKGIVCTQYEMRAVEAVGLVKIDLLGNRALSTIGETVDLVERHRGMRLDPAAIPHADPETAALLARGDTLGVFQMESPAMRSLNRMLATPDLATTIAAVALIRPGPAGSGMKERFVRRLRGEEAVVYDDPRLEPLLGEAMGVLLYEEDVMCVAAEVAGLSLEDGDVLRRAIAGSDAAERERLERVFTERARRRGYGAEAASTIWKHLLQFGAFAFCKAHAAGYGVLAWQTAWLKTHYPVEFACALMNHHAGMYEKRTHLEDAKRRGVRILLPDVNRSQDVFTVEDGCVRTGLSRVRGLSAVTRSALLAARRRGPFRSLEDLLIRIHPARPEAEALVLAGALDFTGRTRPQMICVLAAAFERYRRRDGRSSPAPVGPEDGGTSGNSGSGGAGDGVMGDLFAEAPPWPVPRLPEYPDPERLGLEWSALDVCVRGHPMDLVREEPALQGVLSCREAEQAVGRRVRVAGVLAARRVVPTAGGRRMQFVTLEDRTGLVECTLFPDVYARHRGLVREVGPYVAEGKIETQYGAPTLTVERLARVPTSVGSTGFVASAAAAADPPGSVASSSEPASSNRPPDGSSVALRATPGADPPEFVARSSEPASSNRPPDGSSVAALAARGPARPGRSRTRR